ncbi:bifunctional glutamate N-acetyltransferase/amino-acid acetyltransferase ArgJ [Gammaproteobacteria bacterium]|nr:bifunctional glutamate N-acetyltransferase/amino-acid acetyltransferase ArgJ [Gammaproteobacteria bacterium]
MSKMKNLTNGFNENFLVSGVRVSAVKSGIKVKDRLDLVVFEIDKKSSVAGVFTLNKFCAAPVQLARENLRLGKIRYFLINTGYANAGTGEHGFQAVRRCCSELADITGVDESSVIPFSTGVIGEHLPVEKILNALPAAVNGFSQVDWLSAARGIMTTDTQPKAISRIIQSKNGSIRVSGIAKGSGMIRPDMATMLAFVFCDGLASTNYLQVLLGKLVEGSFNRITVDGDTSTNDSCMLVATGASGVKIEGDKDLEDGLGVFFTDLAVALIRDAEGATKFITVCVEGGADSKECLRVAYAISESTLVKTAMFASDPNWGRILAVVGRSGINDFDIDAVEITIGNTRVVCNGGVDPSYTETVGQVEMAKEDLLVNVSLGRGGFRETVFTSDLSLDYVKINAEYRS